MYVNPKDGFKEYNYNGYIDPNGKAFGFGEATPIVSEYTLECDKVTSYKATFKRGKLHGIGRFAQRLLSATSHFNLLY